MNMYGTCKLESVRCVCLCMHTAQTARVCADCVTDLWRRTWVMMFTTPFHHLSPKNTWNPWNYISLAILCKIFTSTFLHSYPPPSFFIPFFPRVLVCDVPQVCTCVYTHTCTPVLWARKGQELWGGKEGEGEVCGGLMVFKCFHSVQLVFMTQLFCC